nr:HPr family phosphocarrier protein [uncultured Caproiciproducens sp.]
MQKFDYTIQAPEGIHARPAGLLARCAQGCASEVRISLGNKTANAKRLFAILELGIKQGDIIALKVEGENETSEYEMLQACCRKNL